VSQNDLKLYEEVMLLALCEEKGTITNGYLHYAIAGAILAELLLEERISIDEGKKQFINLEDTSSYSDPVIEEALELVREARRRKQLKGWMQKFCTIKDLKHKVAAQLVKHKIVAAEEDKILFLFTRRIYPEINPVPENQIKERLRRAVLSDQQEVDPRTGILLSLAKGTRLLNQVFSKQELRDRKKRIEQITKGELMGGATKELIAACEAAVMVAVIIPAITVTST